MGGLELFHVGDEGLNAYGAVTWGQFFIYQGFNDRIGWMHTSSAVDAVDEYLEKVEKKGDHWEILKPLRASGDDQKIGDLIANNIKASNVRVDAHAKDGKLDPMLAA